MFFFFFQAEDGIRDADVTGVQTCALPISFSMDGTQTGSINVAIQKGLAALRFKRSTKLFQDMVTSDKPHMAFLPGAVPVEGGLPLVAGGQLIGAIGVSGMPSDKDGIVAKAGADFAATLT